MDVSVAEEYKSNIFVDSSGLPLRIFVENQLNEPDLKNQLKSHGARITRTIQSAQFIITDWRSFCNSHYEERLEGKILDYSWIERCIGARRLLLEGDNWGGCAMINPEFSVAQANIEQHDQAYADSQYLPPRLMRRSNPRPVSLGNPDLAALQSFATSSVVPLTPSSHSSSTPTSSRGNDTEPAFITRSQQDGPQPQSQPPQIIPTSNSMVSSWMQAMMPQPVPANPYLFQQMLSNPDILRAQLHFLALCQAQQLQQPYPIPTYPTNTAFAPSSSASSSSKAEDSMISNDSPSSHVSSRKPSREPSRNGEDAQTSYSSKSPPRTLSEPHIPIFTRNGRRLVFFVQIDLSQRHELVNQIKKNGGTITNARESADYAILSSKSKIYSDLFREVAASNTPAVSSSFVHDCIEERTILAHDPKYLLNAPTSRKAGRPTSNDAGPLEKPKVEVTRKDRTRGSAATQKKSEVGSRGKVSQTITGASTTKLETARDKASKEREKPVLKKRSSSAIDKLSESEPRIPSPSPPPENSRVVSSAGRYSYSPLEREYVETYVKVLFERDHHISNTRIAKILHEKMPHHTVNSWNTMVGGQLREMIEKTRKRAGIAYRKNAHTEEIYGRQKPTSEEGDKAVKRQKISKEESRNQDIQFIAHFFADGEANGVDDEDEDRAALWERLHKKVSFMLADREQKLISVKGKWRTPSSWEEFYEENHLEVKRHFSDIIDQEAEQ
ncbi:hypothetical protein F5050DRAFT_11320 [Lentinula boryana]|uniref:BRCT domain-containing protein n=1 Tax=Lentinula boryana TaxID=40481 RepID=A0ABQ8QV62_9AGAR|nr:hypothetical protein F5050DRAFT_11320 [Lentinula boryana]